MKETHGSLSHLFGKSYTYINDNEDLFFDSFYERFTNSSNLIKNAFANADMETHKRMLREAIKHLVEFSLTGEESGYMKHLAKIHKEEIRADRYMYKLFIDSFIATIRKTHPDYCEDTVIAWRLTLKPGLDFLSSHESKNKVIQTLTSYDDFRCMR